jgi:hypothetical protein
MISSYSKDNDSSIELFEYNSSLCDSIQVLLANAIQILPATFSSSTRRRQSKYSPQLLLGEEEDDQDLIVGTRSRVRAHLSKTMHPMKTLYALLLVYSNVIVLNQSC